MSVAGKPPVVVGLGEVLWDCFAKQGKVESRKPGGAPANVAFHANQLGNEGVVLSRVGTDVLGEELLQYLRENGLSTDWVQRDPSLPTGTVTVDATISNQPEYEIHENVAWDNLQFDDACKKLMSQASAVCFGTLAQRSRQSRETIYSCLAGTSPECLRVYDVNLRQHWYEREWVVRSIELASIIKLNNDEVQVLADLLELPSAPPEFAQNVENRWGSRLICVTRGAQGCVLLHHGEQVDVPGVQVEVGDAVGAGDAFTAGLITARLSGWDLQRCAKFANRVGGMVASEHGAMPKLQTKYDALIAEFTELGN